MSGIVKPATVPFFDQVVRREEGADVKLVANIWGRSVDEYAEVARRMGDAVERGQTLGRAKEDLYFEYRSGGESIDPSPLLGL